MLLRCAERDVGGGEGAFLTIWNDPVVIDGVSVLERVPDEPDVWELFPQPLDGLFRLREVVHGAQDDFFPGPWAVSMMMAVALDRSR